MDNGSLHGGARVGAGRKRKSNIEKLNNGNPGRRKLTTIDTGDDLEAIDMPPVSEYLSAIQRDGQEFKAKQIYERTYKWLVRVKCQNIVSYHLIEQFAFGYSRYLQCEDAITKYGLIAKHPTTGGPIQTPYVSMANTFIKQVTLAWNQIYQIVKENSTVDFRADKVDVMEKILDGRWWAEHGGKPKRG